MNSMGSAFRISVFGESHGKCIGVVVDGCPAGLLLQEKDVQQELDKRKPGQSIVTTQRQEADRVQILSGIFNGFSTGAPICMLIENGNQIPAVYEKLKDTPRPGHSDFTAAVKYGGFNDYRGAGQFSGRLTAALVMAGAVARKVLESRGIDVFAHVRQIGKITCSPISMQQVRKKRYSSIVRCADLKAAQLMQNEIVRARMQKDSIGGVVQAFATSLPAGIGEPLFDTLEGEIAKAMFAIPAVKAVGFGAGMKAATMRGSISNDEFIIESGQVKTRTNNSGGILGGISSGIPLELSVTFKPPSSIARSQKTVNLSKMEPADIEVIGRHDPCIVPRAVPVVESVLAIVLCDMCIRAQLIGRVLNENR